MLRILPMPVSQYKINGIDLFTPVEMQNYAIACQEAAKEEALASPKRQWVGLTDDEIKEIIGPWGETSIKGYTRKLFDQIEAKLKEKNT